MFRPPAQARSTATQNEVDGRYTEQSASMDIMPGPLLNAYKTHVEDMRNLIMCKICIRPLYEPFSLGECGHTYCYSCLSEWFANKPGRRKRSCPDCRADVKVQPAPNYLLRELVHMFMSRAELLPRDETLQEHHEAMMAEAALVEKDKNDKTAKGGLFKGVFKLSDYWNHLPRRVLRDDEDGVDRCPMCSWELEEGHCGHCGFDVDADFSDEDDGQSFSTDYDDPGLGDPGEDLDDDIDLDDDDAFGYEFGFHQAMGMPHRFGDASVTPGNAIFGDDVPRNGFWGSSVSNSEADSAEEGEDDDEDSEMDGFIDDEEGDHEAAGDYSDSDNDTIRSAVPHIAISDSSSDVDVDVDYARHNHRHSIRITHNDSEADSSEEEQEADENHDGNVDDDDLEEEEEEEDDDDDDDDDAIPIVRRKTTTQRPAWARRQRIVIDSDSEEEDGNEDDGEEEGESTAREGTSSPRSNALEVEDDDEEEAESSDPTPVASPSPPRPAAVRRARREAQRTRSRIRRS